MLRLVVLATLVGVIAGQTENCQVDIALALDTSGSIAVDFPGTPANWADVLTFATNLVDQFTIGPNAAQFGAVTFSSSAVLEFTLDEYATKQSLRDAVSRLTYPRGGGTTNTNEAYEIVKDDIFNSQNGDRSGARNIVFMVTDGKPNPYNLEELKRSANALRTDSGATIIGVGVGIRVDNDTMNEITDTFFSVKDFQSLDETVARLVAQACPPPQDTNCPAAIDTYAFSAYSFKMDGRVQYEKGMTVPFMRTWSNLGDGYDTTTSQFTCPCDGYYEFSVTISGADHGPGVAIMMDGRVVSPLAYVRMDGAMSTTTIVLCRRNQKVYAEVKVLHEDGYMPCNFDDDLVMHGFTGKLITTRV